MYTERYRGLNKGIIKKRNQRGSEQGNEVIPKKERKKYHLKNEKWKERKHHDHYEGAV